MKRVVPLILGVVLSYLAVAEPEFLPDELARPLAGEACAYMGDSCERFLAECSSSPSPNICLAGVYFKMRVAEERCGQSRATSCFDEQRNFARKWMQELNIPNIGNPKREKAFEVCEVTSQYVVLSDSLKELEASLGNLMGVRGPLYTDYKLYYQCFKKQLE